MNLEQCSDNRNAAQTLSRGLELLKRLATADEDMGVRELARTLALSPAMVQRLLNTLAAHGFVEQTPQTRKYAIGHRAFMVGRAYVAAGGVVDAALPVLRTLVDTTELNAYVGEMRDAHALYLLVLQSKGPVAVRAVPGEHTLLHTTAMGKALLVDMAPDAVVKLVGSSPLQARTPRSITDVSSLLADLADARASGVTISDEENIPGVFSVGAPLSDAEGNVVAAVSLACPAAMVDASARTTICMQVRQVASQISRRLGAPQ
jgi:IclR family KDG regulon transcriptional repressor